MEPLVVIEYEDSEDDTNSEGNRQMVGQYRNDVRNNWYTCTYEGCNFNGRTGAGLQRHLKNHSSERVFPCSKCDRRCATMTMLNEHMKVHSESKPFWCLLCEYKCRNKANLQSHLRSHSDERPHACHLCEYKSKTYMNLKNHLRKHTGEKPFVCPACPYKCSTQGSLNVHLRVHTGEKPYACSECSYRSTTSGGLKSHYKVHSGDKPFKCGRCPESFAKLSLLKNHRNSHVKDNTYRCATCDFQSDVPEEIKDHIAAHLSSWGPLDGSVKHENDRRKSSTENESSSTTSNSYFPGNPSETPKRLDVESDTSSGISSSCSPHFKEIKREPPKNGKSNSVESASEPSISKISRFQNERPIFSLPFPFLDKLFPPNHLHEKYWNETGMKSTFSGHFSMFLENSE